MVKGDAAKSLENLPYFEDYEVYALWKYLNGNLTGRPVFQLVDLLGPGNSYLSLYVLLHNLNQWGITLENPTFDRKGHRWFYKKHRTKKESEAKNSLNNIYKNKFNLVDIVAAFPVAQQQRMLAWIEFKKELSDSNRQILNSFLGRYMDLFVHDQLKLREKSFYTFERQIEKLLMLLRERSKDFGKEFVFEYAPPRDEDGLSIYSPFLFTHSMVAASTLGLVKVTEAWVQDEAPPKRQRHSYKIRLTITEVGSEKINELAEKVVGKRTIMKNSDGLFTYRGAPLNVTLGTNYARAFDILLSDFPQGGFVPYDVLENLLIQNGFEPSKNNEQRNKRINNLLSVDQGFFRYAKLNNKKLPNSAADGKSIIHIRRGKGIEFYNPEI
ncbi:MAG: hypothetical protein WC052_01420 [Patescibacteria group bacterium]